MTAEDFTPLEDTLIGLSLIEQLLGEDSSAEGRQGLYEEFTTLELFRFMTAALSTSLSRQAMLEGLTLSEYINNLRVELKQIYGNRSSDD